MEFSGGMRVTIDYSGLADAFLKPRGLMRAGIKCSCVGERA